MTQLKMDGSGEETEANTLAISGLSAISLWNIFQGMTSFPRHLDYAKLFVACLLTLDSRNALLRNGMRSLLSSMMSQIKSAREREPLGDVILRLCNAANDTNHGKILNWSESLESLAEYPNKHLKATIRACTIYLSGISTDFDIKLGESALSIAFTAKNMRVCGRAFEIIACLDCYGKMSVSDVNKRLPLMGRILEENGRYLVGLNKDGASSILQAHENLASKSLYLSRQICRFLHGLIRETTASAASSDKSELVVYFWMTVAIMRCKIRPIYVHCLDLLSSIFSNKGEALLSAFAKNQAKFFWDFCEYWQPKMDGIGHLLLWGIVQDNYPFCLKSLQVSSFSARQVTLRVL